MKRCASCGREVPRRLPFAICANGGRPTTCCRRPPTRRRNAPAGRRAAARRPPRARSTSVAAPVSAPPAPPRSPGESRCPRNLVRGRGRTRAAASSDDRLARWSWAAQSPSPSFGSRGGPSTTVAAANRAAAKPAAAAAPPAPVSTQTWSSARRAYWTANQRHSDAFELPAENTVAIWLNYVRPTPRRPLHEQADRGVCLHRLRVED